jgi:hypothetical protein
LELSAGSRSSLAPCLNAHDGLRRGDDLYALKALQIEQVRITGNDQVGAGCQGGGEG